MNRISLEEEIRIMKELEQFDTPTITNAVATFPDRRDCLGLYDPQEVGWYTDNTLNCIFPELGPKCGLAVTCTYGMYDPVYHKYGFGDILQGIDEIREKKAPTILILKNNFNEITKNRNAIIGGNMMTAFQLLGVVGAIGDAPARDVEEMRSLGVQCLFRGVAAGHGTMTIQAINTPVEVAGMMVAPGIEVVHMDANGSVKFPRKYLPQVLKNAKHIAQGDEKRQAIMKKLSDPAEIAAAFGTQYE